MDERQLAFLGTLALIPVQSLIYSYLNASIGFRSDAFLAG
jgi:hypothetical protein